MKRILALLLSVAMVILLSSCDANNKSDSTPSSESKSVSKTRDVNGLHEDEIGELVSDYGTIYWEAKSKCYVIHFKGESLRNLKMLMEDPTDRLLLKWWSAMGDTLALITDEDAYFCSIRVANPYNSEKSLMVLACGEWTSVFES